MEFNGAGVVVQRGGEGCEVREGKDGVVDGSNEGLDSEGELELGGDVFWCWRGFS